MLAAAQEQRVKLLEDRTENVQAQLATVNAQLADGDVQATEPENLRTEKSWLEAVDSLIDIYRTHAANTIRPSYWNRGHAQCDVIDGGFIYTRNFSGRCWHYDLPYPDGRASTKQPLLRGHIYGPIL